MRIALATVTLLLAGVAQANDARTLTLKRPAAGVTTINIDAGVGDVQVRGAEVDTVSVRITLRPKRGLLDSPRRTRELVKAVELRAEERDSTLALRLRPAARQGNFEASWSAVIPATAGLRLDAGVGDVRIVGVQGGVSVDLGVGDVALVDVAGDLNVDVGVGDVEVTGEWAAFGSLRVDSGVGEVTLRTPDGRQLSKGFVGRGLSTTGPGTARLRLGVGVGDATIVLR